MELPGYWTCWTRREYNCRPKMLMQKAIPTPPCMPFYCTNRLPAGGRNILLRLRQAEDLEAHHPGNIGLGCMGMSFAYGPAMDQRKVYRPFARQLSETSF